jgi:transcriptional regulator with XRE-family HTH domain
MNEEILQNLLPRIGQIIKKYREKTGQNQSDVAVKANISISMLSQIERGVVSPSIDTLALVCGALGLDMAELFKKVSVKTPVRIHNHRERLTMEHDGIRYEQLITNSEGIVPSELFLLEVQPGKASTLSTQGHEGIEMGYVLDGAAVLTVDGVEYALRKDDSVLFNSRHRHQLRNDNPQAFRAVWSISPPHVDYLNVPAGD